MKRPIMVYQVIIALLVLLILGKCVSVWTNTRKTTSPEREKEDVLKRSRYLKDMLLVSPIDIINAMPESVGRQFQGEWALYSCSMFTKALANMAHAYPEMKSDAVGTMDRLIASVLDVELTLYDWARWEENPLGDLYKKNGHISYYSHLAWMIGNYRRTGGDGKYDQIYHELCANMNKQILASSNLNLPTYPDECIYVPDMCVAIVALKEYSDQFNGRYSSTVSKWVNYMKAEAEKNQYGLIPSFIVETANEPIPVKGSYTALSCYYLTMIDDDFARDQYGKMKTEFVKRHGIKGLKEYNDRSRLFGFDLDAGPIIFNLSPSGTAFAVGPITHFHDDKLRRSFMRTAEMAGQTVTFRGRSHYLLANVALVGEAIMLAMRTSW